MIVNQAYKYELKPNNKQVGLLLKHCGVARFAWNWGLARRKELYKTQTGDNRYTNSIEQHRELNALKKSEFQWMYEVSKCAPHQALRDLDKAYSNFYRGHKTGEKIGLPKFKKKGTHDSYGLWGIIRIANNSILLPRIGLVRTKESTNKFHGNITTATISRIADRWYCSLCVKVDREISTPITNDIVGIDLGLHDFATISNGYEYKHIKAPKPLSKELSKLQKLQRKQSHKQLNSKNRIKSNLKIAKHHHRIQNIRRDFINKLTSELTKTKSVIIIEDLNIKGMQNKKRHLGRSISDVGWGEFRRQLEYKSIWYGSQLINIPRFEPTSKICSNCKSKKHELKLSERIWICENCGTTHDRDENASDNIRNYGLKILATESSSGSNACGESIRPLFVEAILNESGSKHIYVK